MRRAWFAVLAGPLAWFVAHVASWMLAPPAHDSGSVTGLYVVDAGALAIAIAGALVALRRVQQLRRAPAADTGLARFVAAGGLALSSLAIVLVLGLVLPVILLGAGAEP